MRGRSKAHFKAAASAGRAGGGAHGCPHEGCTNTYKQRTGLQYHLAHVSTAGGLDSHADMTRRGT